MLPMHPDLATHYAKQRVASLLEEAEHDRLARRARAATAAQGRRRRLARTLRAYAPRAVHQHAGAR
jgi:hypothetical protein